MTSRLVDAVTFDHWNTLVFEDGDMGLSHMRVDAWAARLAEEGHVLSSDTLHSAFNETWQAFIKDWHSGVQRSGADAAAHALEVLALPITDEVHAELIELFVGVGDRAEFGVTDGLEDTLQALRDNDIRIGIICDVGFTPSTTLRNHLERRGLLKYFDGWSFSDEVGTYKPDKAIFEHALGTIGNPAPGRVAHVGDLRRTDVAGALAMGMIAVRYSGVFDDPAENGPDATHTISHHAELPALLGI